MSNLVPFPEPGWTVGILLQETDDAFRVDFLPVVGMFVDAVGEIELVVAFLDGRVLRARAAGLDVLCLTAPGEDIEEVSRVVLRQRLVGSAKNSKSIVFEDRTA